MNQMKLPLKVLAVALMSQLVISNPAYSETFHPKANELELLWKVVDHDIGENIFLGSLTITNNGTEMLSDKDWSLYFSSVRPPASVLPLDNIDGINARKQMLDQNVLLKNADDAASGDYFVLEPVAGFLRA